MHTRFPSSLLLLTACLFSLNQFHHVLSASVTRPEGTELLKHTLITRTDVSQLAAITENVRRMYQECSKNDFKTARTTYESNHYAKYSLKQLATTSKFQNIGMTYAFQMYGLTNEKFEQYTDDQKQQYRNFADVFIQSLLVDENVDYAKCEQASIATVWLVLYMQASYELWGAMEDCGISGDPNYNNEAAGIPDHNSKADEFIAYWVGSLNEDLKSVTGYSPFSATNKIAQYFGTLDNNGAAFANMQILTGYESLSALLSSDDVCDMDNSPSTLKSMWLINNQITPFMLVPLIQHLIKAMIEDKQTSIDVYAKIVVPQLIQCRSSTYNYLKENLLDKKFDRKNIHLIVKALQNSYDCLGIKCEDIGVPEGTFDSNLFCTDKDYDKPNFAGYQSTVDVREEAEIDLDVHQMKILVRLMSIISRVKVTI